MGSATTQSSLHQPGSWLTWSQVTSATLPSGRLPVILPAAISEGTQAMGAPAFWGPPAVSMAKGYEPNLTSINWWVGPLTLDSAFSRMIRARIRQASSRVGALMLTRSKKSASPGYVWMRDWAAEPDSASAVSTTPGSSENSTNRPMFR